MSVPSEAQRSLWGVRALWRNRLIGLGSGSHPGTAEGGSLGGPLNGHQRAAQSARCPADQPSPGETLRTLLPRQATVVTASEAPGETMLLLEERSYVAAAVERRVQEFALGRH